MNSIDSQINSFIFYPVNLPPLKLNRLFQGVIESDLTIVQQELAKSQPIDWQEQVEGHGLREWSAIKLNFGDSDADTIFQQIQICYAKSVGGSITQKAENFFEDVKLWTTKREFLAHDASQKLQKFLVSILKNYLPDSSILSYVTEKSLDSIHPLYNANQTLYALWCDLTARALAHNFRTNPIYNLKNILAFCAHSRQLLAETCKLHNASHFGTMRLHKDKVVQLLTPMNDQYSDWRKFNEARAKKGDRKVYTYFPAGERVLGTQTIEVDDLDDDITYFSWVHGENPKLHFAAQAWLAQATLASSTKAIEQIGKFYHTMVQYTPLTRGSATVSMILMNALFMYHKIPLPKAVTLLDCYALSMQQKEFVKNVFIPFATEKVDDAGLKELLKKKTTRLQEKSK